MPSKKKDRSTPVTTTTTTGGGGGTGGFVGFSAFADPASTIAGAVASDSTGAARAGSSAPGAAACPSPIFSGSDPGLHQLFRRIGQKRDATTRVRALAELAAGAFGGGGPASSSAPASASASAPAPPPPLGRQDRVAALSHLTYLSLTRLLWDNSPAVRRSTVHALTAAASSVPRAWAGLILHGAPTVPMPAVPGGHARGQTQTQAQAQAQIRARPRLDPGAVQVLPDGELARSGLTVAALVYVLRCDPSREVADAADAFHRRLERGPDDGDEDQDQDEGGEGRGKGKGEEALRGSVVNLVLAALRLGGAGALDGAVFGGGGGSGSGGRRWKRKWKRKWKRESQATGKGRRRRRRRQEAAAPPQPQRRRRGPEVRGGAGGERGAVRADRVGGARGVVGAGEVFAGGIVVLRR